VADLVVDLAYLTASLASKADSTNTDAALALKASSAEVDSALALKADAAATTAALAGKAATSSLANYVTIFSLGAHLSLKANATDVTTSLAGKQDTTVDGGLAIAKISGLQAALDGAGGGDIADGELTIAKTQGLQSALDAKASTASMNTALSYKQNLIGAGSIAVSATSGLQAALDSKGPALSDLAGTGTFLTYDPTQGVVRKIYGHGGVVIDQTLDTNNLSNPDNFQI